MVNLHQYFNQNDWDNFVPVSADMLSAERYSGRSIIY